MERRSEPLPVRTDHHLVIDENDRTTQQCRLLNHQVDQLIFADLALSQAERLVGPAARREQITRREARAPEQLDQLLAGEATVEIVTSLIGYALLSEELLSPPAPRSGGVHVDLDRRRPATLPLGHRRSLRSRPSHFPALPPPQVPTASECSHCQARRHPQGHGASVFAPCPASAAPLAASQLDNIDTQCSACRRFDL